MKATISKNLNDDVVVRQFEIFEDGDVFEEVTYFDTIEEAELFCQELNITYFFK